MRSTKSVIPALILLLMLAVQVSASPLGYEAGADLNHNDAVDSGDRATALANYERDSMSMRPTRTPTVGATSTPPHVTPAPSQTAEPTSTVTPSVTPPVGSLPLCTQHIPNAWHGLISANGTCHYDHEHKHDPNEVADIFGPAGAWFGGTSLSYPWQTPMENMHKHEAYAWIVRRDIPALDREVWIKDFRLQVHATSAPFTMANGTLSGGYLGRDHSMSLEAQVCRTSDGACGIIRTGGWIDFGNLEVRRQGVTVLEGLPGEEDAIPDLGRRRIHFHHLNPDNIREKGLSTYFWYGRVRPLDPPYSENVPLHPFLIAVATGDATVNVIPDDLYSLNFICPEYDCVLNDSTVQSHVVGFAIRAEDPDGDGLGDLNTFTDRRGRLAPTCTTVGPECIPLIIQGAPTGVHLQHRDDDINITPAGTQDFDISPPGEWWIGYPN